MASLVKPLSLRDKSGILLMDKEENPANVKEGIVYLNSVVGDMAEGEYMSWLQERKEENLDHACLKKIRNAVFTPEFAFMQKESDQLISAVSNVVDYLLIANNMYEIKEIKE